MNKKLQAVIVSGVRTPMGSFNGVFSPVPTTKLGSIVVTEALKRINLRPDHVDEVYMGCVLSAGLGQAPARQASIGAGIPNSVGATTVTGSWVQPQDPDHGRSADCPRRRQNRRGRRHGKHDRAPYLLEKLGKGIGLDMRGLVDESGESGLWDVYNNFHMGKGANSAAKYRLTRRELDDFALESYRRAPSHGDRGLQREIVPVDVPQRKARLRPL